MAAAHQPARHVRAHPAKSDHSELHAFLLVVTPPDTANLDPGRARSH
jgi:hypothetical protein